MLYDDKNSATSLNGDVHSSNGGLMERRLFFGADGTHRKPRKYCMRSYLSGASGAIGAQLSGLAAFVTHAIPRVYIFLNMNTPVCRCLSKIAVHLRPPNVCVRVCARVCVCVCVFVCS